MNMIMRFLMTLFFVVSEINGVLFLEREEGEFLKWLLRTCSCYFCLFWYQIRHIHCLWCCLLLSYVFWLNKREKKINLKNHSLVILDKNIAANTFRQIVLSLISSGEYWPLGILIGKNLTRTRALSRLFRLYFAINKSSWFLGAIRISVK